MIGLTHEDAILQKAEDVFRDEGIPVAALVFDGVILPNANENAGGAGDVRVAGP